MFRMLSQGPYSTDVNLIATYERPTKLVFHSTRLERLSRDKHSSLVCPIVNYEENEVLWPYIQNMIFM